MEDFVIELKNFNLQNFQVVNVLFKVDMQKIPGERFVTVSIRDALQIKKIIEKEILLLPREKFDISVEIPVVTLNDFTKLENSDLVSRKLSYLSRINANINYQVATISGIELFEYFVISTSFAERGIVINDQNREEKYLEIISSEDEYLINMLESYLEIKEKSDKVYARYKELVNVRNRISGAQNDEALDEILRTVSPRILPR
jgi:hypothetical protein